MIFRNDEWTPEAQALGELARTKGIDVAVAAVVERGWSLRELMAVLLVTIEDSILAALARKRVEAHQDADENKDQPCDLCKGTGTDPPKTAENNAFSRCPRCNGYGKIRLDCAGCIHRHWVEAAPLPHSTSSSGWGCSKTGGHATARCAAYEVAQPVEMKPLTPEQMAKGRKALRRLAGACEVDGCSDPCEPGYDVCQAHRPEVYPDDGKDPR